MLGAAYAAVPLYAAFCRATGFAGTPQRVEQASGLRGERRIQVSFDANVAPGLDWSFEPETQKRHLAHRRDRDRVFQGAQSRRAGSGGRGGL